jgi:hypothetical protein
LQISVRKPFGWSTAVIFEVLRRALDIARGGQR